MDDDWTLIKAKTSLISQSELKSLTGNSLKDWEIPTIVLKKFSQECSKANISTQPLIKLLSIIYGQLMVTRGLQAVLLDKISSAPIVLNRTSWTAYVREMMEINHSMDSILLNAQRGLDAGSTAGASTSSTDGA